MKSIYCIFLQFGRGGGVCAECSCPCSYWVHTSDGQNQIVIIVNNELNYISDLGEMRDLYWFDSEFLVIWFKRHDFVKNGNYLICDVDLLVIICSY